MFRHVFGEKAGQRKNARKPKQFVPDEKNRINQRGCKERGKPIKTILKYV